MPRILTVTLVLVAACLIGCSARLLLDGDINADSTRPHPNPVLIPLSAGD